MHVQALALADEGSSVRSEVKDLLLRNFPDGFIDRLDIIRNVRDVLNRTIVGDDHVFHVVIPQVELNEFAEEPGADDLEFACEDTSGVDVAGVRLEALVVAQNLACGGSGHGRNEQRVA